MTKEFDSDNTTDGLPQDPSRRRLIQRALGGSAALSVGALAGTGLALPGTAFAADRDFPPKHPNWHFVFVNHVTTNPFFVPTQYGAADACSAFGCSYQWTGSQKSIASQMVDSMNTAINSGADGIAISLVDQHAFQQPVERALKAGIPVVAYNADVKDNARLAYVGQDLYDAGKELGQRIASHVKSGAHVVGFIATPGQLNIQPRMDGARDAIKASGKNITLDIVSSGPTVNEEFSRVESYFIGHKNVNGMFAVDAGSTEAVGKTMAKHDLHKHGVVGGGFDMLPGTLEAISSGVLDFTIDQQPYLQGFYPVLELFLYKLSGGLSGMADVNTGLKFVTKSNVGPYLHSKSRFEGDSREEKVLKRSGPIAGR